MSDCKIYPSDTVDVYGNVWPTVGENIRYGLIGMKVKRGFIEIKNGKITSTDFIVSNISSSQFTLDKIAIIAFPISCKSGYISLRISLLNNSECVLVSQDILENISGEIEVIYMEKKHDNKS